VARRRFYSLNVDSLLDLCVGGASSLEIIRKINGDSTTHGTRSMTRSMGTPPNPHIVCVPVVRCVGCPRRDQWRRVGINGDTTISGWAIKGWINGDTTIADQWGHHQTPTLCVSPSYGVCPPRTFPRGVCPPRTFPRDLLRRPHPPGACTRLCRDRHTGSRHASKGNTDHESTITDP
jgi:hypothetical protein